MAFGDPGGPSGRVPQRRTALFPPGFAVEVVDGDDRSGSPGRDRRGPVVRGPLLASFPPARFFGAAGPVGNAQPSAESLGRDPRDSPGTKSRAPSCFSSEGKIDGS